MPALNFQERFAEPVKLGLIDRNAPGAKTQTIRPRRKYPIKPGDTLQLYTGMRTKKSEKLGEAICKNVSDIKIESDMIIINRSIYCFGNTIAANILAQKDGFDNWTEMRDWFEKQYDLPFVGELIEW